MLQEAQMGSVGGLRAVVAALVVVLGGLGQAAATRVAAQETGQATAPVNERANLLRSQADEAYQRGDYKRVIEIGRAHV